MHDTNFRTYDTSGYDVSDLPYIPYAPPLTEPQSIPEPEGLSEESQHAKSDDYTSYASVPGQFTGEAARPARKSRRKWPIVAGILAAFLLVASVASYGIYSYVSYVNRSTPMKTLDAFCTDLKKEDYKAAYNQFSTNLQSQLSEEVFSSYLTPDKIVSCSHGVAPEAGTSSKTDLKLVHNSQGVNNDTVFLKKDDTNIWKIDDLQQATALLSSISS